MILVTGGAGFIGSVLVKYLNQLGHTNIIIVDRLRSADKWKNLRDLKYAEFIHADDLFNEQFKISLSTVKKIYHMGAYSSTTERDVVYLMKNNVHYSQRLFKLALEHELPFVYASSGATYGDGELGYDDDHGIVPKLKPLNPYGYSKQFFDEWVLKRERKPARWYGVKFFNVYGPNEYHKNEMKSLVCKAYGQIKTSGEVKLFKSHKEGFKDGEQLRDFIYVWDVVKALVAMMESPDNKKSGIYNMGTGTSRSFYDLVGATFKSLNLVPNIKFIDMPLEIRHQYQYFTEAKMTKFKQNFPDVKFTKLEDAVDDYVKNYLVKNAI